MGHTRHSPNGTDKRGRFIPTYVGHTAGITGIVPVSPGSSPHTWGILSPTGKYSHCIRFIPTYVGHTAHVTDTGQKILVHPHIRGAYRVEHVRLCPPVGSSPHTWGIRQSTSPCRPVWPVHPHIRGAYFVPEKPTPPSIGSSPHTWGIHWTTVRKMAGFSHFSYDFTQKSYFVQGLVFFGVIGAEAFPTHRRGRSQCLPGAHGGSVRNL